MAWVVGVDVGGTFTDFFLSNRDTGEAVVHKAPSTPHDPSRAILDGLAELQHRLGIRPGAIERFAHGTTIATNTLLERTGGRVALITTAGFRDLVEIGRQTRPKVYDLQADAPEPLVPRERRFEAAERIGPRGEVLRELGDDEIAGVVEKVAAAGVDCCAVCLLFSFLNPTHEQRIGAALRARCPDLHVSLSCEVQPEFREYERFSTTILNAFLKPKVSRYMRDLAAALAGRAAGASVGISQSSGGLMNIARASEVPIRTALSGPAAGVVGAIAVAGRCGRADLITLDIGGTSTDVCLIENGAAAMTPGRAIAEFPVRLPSIDIHTIGAGGGSIAHVGPDGLLKVGPISAGAVPGPACYGRGGTRPTVSDANVVLGRLPERLVGGGMTLDRDAAARAIMPLAERFGLTLHETALGIVRIVTSNMVRAIRAVSVERGYDPRRFTLMPYGGAGGLHAADVARELGMREILVPLSPGILCAEGVAVSDLEESFVATCRTAIDRDLGPVRNALQDLSARAERWLADAGGGSGSVSATLEMRYVGQNYELAVPVDVEGRAALPDPARLRTAFLAEHQAKYGHHDPAARIEVVNVRLRARLGFPGPLSAKGVERVQAGPPSTASVWFDADAPVETAVIDRGSLEPGRVLSGPAIVTQFDATTVIPPGAGARTDEARNLVIEVAP